MLQYGSATTVAARLDYTMGSLAWKDVCTQAAPLLRLGRRPQAIPDTVLRNHVPAHANIMYD
eukprot:4221114-Pyramimonas_sp.AAC.1